LGETVVVLDFETTGLSPEQGARATEIALVLVRDGRAVERYQSLMNAGVPIPPYIEALTGISNAMIRRAPPAAEVMREAIEFIGDYPLVAHNASFDRKFLDAELARIRKRRRQEFACSMLVARRVYPNAPNHKLGTLIEYTGIPVAGRYHRALADAEMTVSLMLKMQQDLMRQFGLPSAPHHLLRAIQCVQRNALEQCIQQYCRSG
jgi:DNA polymerase III subunit epsilon